MTTPVYGAMPAGYTVLSSFTCNFMNLVKHATLFRMYIETICLKNICLLFGAFFTCSNFRFTRRSRSHLVEPRITAAARCWTLRLRSLPLLVCSTAPPQWPQDWVLRWRRAITTTLSARAPNRALWCVACDLAEEAISRAFFILFVYTE